MFVVESEASARERGARPLARILGWGSTQDGYRVTAPLPDGSQAKRAMARAIERAGLQPSEIGYVNAHGTGTPLNDPAEARASREPGRGEAPAKSKHARFLRRMALFGHEVALEAWKKSGLQLPAERIGVFCGYGGLRAHWNEMMPALQHQRDDLSQTWERGLK